MRARLFSAAALALLPAPALAADPVDAFTKVCMGGEARFARGEIAPATRADLPREVRKDFRVVGDETIYRVGGAADAFLVIQSEKSGRRGCTLIARGVPLVRGVEAMNGQRLSPADRADVQQAGTYHSAKPGYSLRGDVIPPDFLIATVRQDAAAPAPPAPARTDH